MTSFISDLIEILNSEHAVSFLGITSHLTRKIYCGNQSPEIFKAHICSTSSWGNSLYMFAEKNSSLMIFHSHFRFSLMDRLLIAANDFTGKCIFKFQILLQTLKAAHTPFIF